MKIIKLKEASIVAPKVTAGDLSPSVTAGAQPNLQPTNYPPAISSQHFTKQDEVPMNLSNPAETDPDGWLNRSTVGDRNSSYVNRTGSGQITENDKNCSTAMSVYKKYVKQKVSEELDKSEEAEDAAIEKKVEPDKNHIKPKKKTTHETIRRRIQGPNLKPEIQSWN